MPNNLRYDYAGDSRLLEGADWIGRRPGGLQLHYHEEAQVSVIWNGHRDYRIGAHLLRLHPGQLLIIPRLRPHHALPSLQGEVRSAEFYLAPDALPAVTRQVLEAFDYLIADAPELLETAPCDVIAFIAARMAEDRLLAGWCGPSASHLTADGHLLEAVARHDRVCEAAAALGFSREGFIRIFSRSFGMTPHAYRINDRLNLGRRLLRDGETISDTAYAAGFSDQSHFGRTFLRLFGATPGQFQAAHTT
ncbi:helix-turn-helix domain-containing protein [Phreatobacter stygius]|nr:AraC family transcriptional regulator [Phreatobacter stygius]